MNLKHVLIWLLAGSVCCLGIAEGIVVAPDNSLAAMELISQGMPSFDRVWTAEDSQAAAKMITGIASKDPTMLPRKNSTNSGVLFSRMVAFENLDVTEQTRGTTVEVDHILGFLGPSIEIFQTYASATSGSSSYDAEVVDYCIYLLEITNRLFPLAAKLAGIGSTENEGQNGDGSVQDKVMQGLSTMVGGLLTILGDQEEMRIKELTRLANALQNYLGKISQFILPGTKKEFVVRISGMVQEATDPDYGDSLRKLLSVF
jgi:hypothetical protein